MNREIKFRGRHYNSEKILFGDLHVGNGYYYINNVIADPKTIGQYTGLKDSKGMEIYEGDIMTHPEFQKRARLQVRFSEGCFCLEGWDCIRTDFTKGTVIGNIHEN